MIVFNWIFINKQEQSSFSTIAQEISSNKYFNKTKQIIEILRWIYMIEWTYDKAEQSLDAGLNEYMLWLRIW